MSQIHVKQVRSIICCTEQVRLTMRGLGLKRRGQTVVLRDNPAIRGMIRKVQHLVEVRVQAGEAELFGMRHRANRPKRGQSRQGS